jgi:hypothetical protein
MTQDSNKTSSSKSRIQSKTLEISPKSFYLKLKSPANLSYSYRTPKSITKRLKTQSQKCARNGKKPYEKTFLNPIIPNYNIFDNNSKKALKNPDIRVKVQTFQISYLKNSHYPMISNNKLKYSAVLDSFHFNY